MFSRDMNITSLMGSIITLLVLTTFPSELWQIILAGPMIAPAQKTLLILQDETFSSNMLACSTSLYVRSLSIFEVIGYPRLILINIVYFVKL
jgi:hypothetical protein